MSDLCLFFSLFHLPSLFLFLFLSEIGKIGMSVCYDIRFPTMYQKMSALGAEIVFVPSAFTVPTGAAHWIPLLQTRAIENQFCKAKCFSSLHSLRLL